MRRGRVVESLTVNLLKFSPSDIASPGLMNGKDKYMVIL